MKNKLVRVGAALVLALSAALSLGACGDGGSNGDDPAATQESEAFIKDLEDGVQIINDKIAEISGMTQIMLASDVDRPTEKYEMWVMPYYPSEAVKKYTMTIQIKNGTDFYVTAVSAETGKTWQMDQAGKMTEVPEKT
ncbi:MAG: hypothetical protein LBH76_08390 [Propionibacteriaceae bacterium]|jgi:hypothetical protein|nr:hypothetical protein [Propionibacteriaceae bacterium]